MFLIKTPLAYKWVAGKQHLSKFSWRFQWEDSFFQDCVSGLHPWSGSQFAPEIGSQERFREGDQLLPSFLIWRELSRQTSGLWLKLHPATLIIGASFLTQYTEEWLNSYKVWCFLHIIFLQWATKPVNSSFNFQVQIPLNQWELKALQPKIHLKTNWKASAHLKNSYGFFLFFFCLMSYLSKMCSPSRVDNHLITMFFRGKSV